MEKSVLQKAKDALWCIYEAHQYYMLVLHFEGKDFISEEEATEAEKGEEKFYQRLLALDMVLSARQGKETKDDAREHAVERFAKNHGVTVDYVYINW